MLGHSNHVIFGIDLQEEKYDTLFYSHGHKYCSVYFRDWATSYTKVRKSVIFEDIFIWKAVSKKLKIGGGKSVHFLKGLFKTYSKMNVW